MWNRKEIKAAGKAAFKANYWRCVLVALIIAAIGCVIGGVSGITSSTGALVGSLGSMDNGMSISVDGDDLSITGADGSTILEADSDSLDFNTSTASANEVVGAMAILTAIAAPLLLVGVAITILVLNPFTVSYSRFFLQNSRKTKAEPFDGADLNELGYGYTHRFGRNVLTMFLRDLFTCLWTLLFIIPGLVKSYSYRMVPYILSDNEEMTATEAITKSREIMNGNKWRSFVLDLSFIGWILLSCITLGIVGIFYVNPYISATEAELYEAIKD